MPFEVLAEFCRGHLEKGSFEGGVPQLVPQCVPQIKTFKRLIYNVFIALQSSWEMVPLSPQVSL
ncbi:hypothetical protein CHELA17_64812 [Chelatococcus asaccharovorans]|nr:hypothetical protein CHELA17_64812 [Chelatococcus asaccharovorans]